MQTKDFKGQDLRGRSFKNQDLTAADFSGCVLTSFNNEVNHGASGN